MMDLHDIAMAAAMAGGSGSGGTSDYTQLTNKPSINGTILIGNKTLSDLGIEWIWRGTRAEYEAAAATIPPNTFVDITDEPDMDTVPTDGSTNPVESNGVYDALAGKMPASTKYGASITTTIDALTYVLTTTLKDQDGNTLGTAQTVDLPLETMVVGAEYDSVNQALIIILNNGTRTSVPIGALVTGLLPDYGTYTQFSSGKRLYLSSTEPTGDDIPEGSVWVGGTVST